MDLEEALLGQQGVVSRRQLLNLGFDDDFIEKRLRRRDWARVHRGVYIDHTGPLSWLQRLWAAVLLAAPAAADSRSALVLHGLVTPSATEIVHVVVADDRRVQAPAGIHVRTLHDWSEHVHPSRKPPLLRLETAVLRAASHSMNEQSAVALLADACRSRRTTPHRLADALSGLPTLRNRKLLLTVLQEVDAGAHSVLEQRYLTRVERLHGLPSGRRQRRVIRDRQVTYRDVEYLGGAVIVELDGRLGHDDVTSRWADLERDINSAVTGSTTVRLGWSHVISPCRAATAVARLLRHRGWQGRPKRCGPGCEAISLDLSA